jgi:hypothetical protein
MHVQTEMMVHVAQVAGPTVFLLVHCPPGGAFGGTRVGSVDEGVVAAFAVVAAKVVGATNEGTGVAVAKGMAGASWLSTWISSSICATEPSILGCATEPSILGSLLTVIFLFMIVVI